MGINKRILNLFIIIFIIYLIYQSSGLWINVINLSKKIIYPLLFSFTLAYAIYPFFLFLKKKKLPSSICVIIIISIFFSIVISFILFIVPIISKELYNLFNSLIVFLEYLMHKYNLNITSIENIIFDNFNIITDNIQVLPKIFSKLSSFITLIFLSFSFFIYILINMDKIRGVIKNISLKKSQKILYLLINIDKELKDYYKGFTKIMIITLFEYTISFVIIGHPNYLILGFCAAISSFIPYFGGIIINGVALLLAFVISKSLFIKTLILSFILSMIDSYVINPYVYGKTNKIHPFVSILSFFIGSTLFGIIGIIFSMPVTIILLKIFKFLKEDLYDTKT